jgi:hypothetical protein
LFEMGSGRFRRLLIACIAAVVAATLAATVSAAPSQPTPTFARNERAARLDANRLLASLQLPAGAIRLSAEPSGDRGWLKPLSAPLPAGAHFDVHAWWQVPGNDDSTIEYVEEHPPAGAMQSATGSGVDGQSSDRSVSFSWPAVPGVLRVRTLTVTATSLQGNVTGVLAEAASDWIVPRPAGEKIPAGVHEIEITGAKLNGPTTVSLSVTNPATVRRIVSLIDAMPVAQPITIACPIALAAGARVITLTFRAHAGSRVLAYATYTDYRPLTAPSGQCTPVYFSIRGRPQDPLIGGNFVKRLEDILDVSLTSG